jgi:hypothetical protein
MDCIRGPARTHPREIRRQALDISQPYTPYPFL